jgi:hypothetical protein
MQSPSYGFAGAVTTYNITSLSPSSVQHIKDAYVLHDHVFPWTLALVGSFLQSHLEA